MQGTARQRGGGVHRASHLLTPLWDERTHVVCVLPCFLTMYVLFDNLIGTPELTRLYLMLLNVVGVCGVPRPVLSVLLRVLEGLSFFWINQLEHLT